MENINLVKFSFLVWLRFQLVTLAAGSLCSLATFKLDAFFFLGYFELINAAFSAVGCASYGLLVYALIKRKDIQYQSELKPIFHHAGWLNVVLLFAIYTVVALATNEIDKGIIAAICFALPVILIGQIAIYWTVSKLQLNEFDNEKLENLLNEFGTEIKEEY